MRTACRQLPVTSLALAVDQSEAWEHVGLW